MARKLMCLECPAPATWVRRTQFAGSHGYCDSCAPKEPDFLRETEDDSFFWRKVTDDGR